MFDADREEGQKTGPAGAAGDTSVMVVAGAERAHLLHRALAAGRFRTIESGTLEQGVDLLSREPVDALLIDAERLRTAPASALAALRSASARLALILVGKAEDIGQPTITPAAWIDTDAPPHMVGWHLQAAIDRQRLVRETERLRAALEESETRFGNIVERTADGIVIVGSDGRIRFVNAAAEAIFGKKEESLLGATMGIAVVAEETVEMDIVRHPGEEPIVAELRASTTSWDGEPAQLLALRDITDRKRAEERAQRLLVEQAAREHAEKTGQRFRFLAEAGAALDASLNPETTLVNLARLIVPRVAEWCVIDLIEGDRIRRVAGVHQDPEKEALLERLKNEYPPDIESSQPVARVVRSGQAEIHRGLDPDRLRSLAVSDSHAELLLRLGVRSSMIVPLEVRGRRLGAISFVCHARDFEDADLDLARELANRAAGAIENAQLYEAALAGNQAKTEFLAVMSHELRTPLNAILGYTDLLLAGLPGEVEPRTVDFLRRIHRGAMQLLQIIEEVLTYAQTETGRAEAEARTVLLGPLIRGVVSIGEPLIREKGLALEVEITDPDAALFTDEGKVQRIVLNLLDNAVKFTDEGTVKLAARVAADVLEIEVTDTGVGIQPDEMDLIFEPFRQVEQGKTRRVGGTGLGLSVSRQLARLLGGDIGVASAPGAGSRFTVQVPRRIGPDRND